MNTICDVCKDAQASHKAGDSFMCCACYVAAGNPPADWHQGCMEAYRDKQVLASIDGNED